MSDRELPEATKERQRERAEPSTNASKAPAPIPTATARSGSAAMRLPDEGASEGDADFEHARQQADIGAGDRHVERVGQGVFEQVEESFVEQDGPRDLEGDAERSRRRRRPRTSGA